MPDYVELSENVNKTAFLAPYGRGESNYAQIDRVLIMALLVLVTAAVKAASFPSLSDFFFSREKIP